MIVENSQHTISFAQNADHRIQLINSSQAIKIKLAEKIEMLKIEGYINVFLSHMILVYTFGKLK